VLILVLVARVAGWHGDGGFNRSSPSSNGGPMRAVRRRSFEDYLARTPNGVPALAATVVRLLRQGWYLPSGWARLGGLRPALRLRAATTVIDGIYALRMETLSTRICVYSVPWLSNKRKSRTRVCRGSPRTTRQRMGSIFYADASHLRHDGPIIANSSWVPTRASGRVIGSRVTVATRTAARLRSLC